MPQHTPGKEQRLPQVLPLQLGQQVPAGQQATDGDALSKKIVPDGVNRCVDAEFLSAKVSQLPNKGRRVYASRQGYFSGAGLLRLCQRCLGVVNKAPAEPPPVANLAKLPIGLIGGEGQRCA